MIALDSLDVGAPHPLYMSSHPFEERPDDGDYPAALSAFITVVRERGIGTVTPLLLAEETIGGTAPDRLYALYRKAGLEVVPYPLLNYGAPDSSQEFHRRITDTLGRLRTEGVLVHCRSGCGRTALVAAGVLIAGGVRPPEAIDRVCGVRPQALPSLTQIQFLRGYYRWLRG